jgi:hypothetical protein
MLLMKNYVGKYVMAMVLGGTLFLTSCSKDDDPVLSRKEQLVGTWRIVQFAHDDNKNGVSDPSEIQTDPGSGNINIETFNADGTGSVRLKNSGADTTIHFTWAITGGDAYLEVNTPGTPTVTQKIVSMSATDLQLENNTNPDGKDWTWLKKQ